MLNSVETIHHNRNNVNTRREKNRMKSLMLTVVIILSSALTIGAEPLSWNEALRQPATWYSSAEAVRIADNILLYQYPNGGWPKNIDLTRTIDSAEGARIRSEIEQTTPTRYPTTIDNGAVHRPMYYLARVYEQTGIQRIGSAFHRGVDYILAAQYDNGGWPQFYPLRSSYHDHITFNDGAMVGVLRLLRDIAEGNPPYGFVDDTRRKQAHDAVQKGLTVILTSQITIDGKLTAWCAQHDAKDFRPRQARAYEYPSLSGWESVGIVQYLMEIEKPSPAVVRAIESAIAWFHEAQIEGFKIVERTNLLRPEGLDIEIVADDSAAPLWARFYHLKTQRPIFADRDGTVHDEFADMEYERRIGYRWLGTWPQRLLDIDYPRWRARLKATD
jgi:PelA/Pel-15E family pectate lyase